MSDPSGVDLLCLGCHDGSVAIDTYGGATGSITMATGFQVGASGSLSNDHPVSFSYDEVAPGGTDPDAGINAVAVPIAAGIKFFGTGNQVKCASCHDPHNAPGNASLLRSAPATICADCHAK